jgi:FKBP-type peptidyl-prolyl cis-trans isomerase (trigger factor)
MKAEVKKIDDITREINVEVSGDIVKNKFEDVFQRIAKEAKVPGFRPGHAPRDILEKHYSSHAHEEVLKELVPEVYNQAIDQEKLDVIELPQITDVKLDRSSFSFKARVEIKPQINIKNYKGLKIKYKKISIGNDEVTRSLDSVKEMRKLAAIDDSFARSLGYPNVTELEVAVEKQLFIQKENQQRQEIENNIIEKVIGDVEFKLPQSLVSRQMQDMLKQAKVELAMRGVPREKIEEEEKKLLTSIEPDAKKQVKVYLVLSEIAKKENIPVDDNMPRRVMEFLLKEADWQQE